ncbi:hypothetical protein JYU20_02225 [Bacteroidales bacterium AH-315-I05]|nr:hypothetical protein [Bacteroidales bacterium AH-315-I05]
MPPGRCINLNTSVNRIGLILTSFVSLTFLQQGNAQDLTNRGVLNAGASPALYVNSITNENSATLEVKGNLTIKGNFTNNGTLNTNTSTVYFIGTTTQNIQGTALNDQFYNFFISNGTGSIVLNKDILINGNLTNNGTFNGNGKKLTMNGSALQIINGNGAAGNTFYDLTIANSGVGIRLNKNIEVSNQLLMNDGDVDLNGLDIDLGTTGAIVNETNDKRIYGASGSIIARNRDLGPLGDYNNIAGLGINLQVSSGGNTPGITTIKRTYTNYATTVDRSFDIFPTTNSNLNIIMTFHYFENELNDTEANLTGFRSTDNGVTWTDQGGVVNTALNHIIIDSITGFSIWSASKKSNSPLPIELLSFSGKVEERKIRLDWTTISEINNDYFIIERSADGINYDGLTQVLGAGNSNATLHYTTYDENPLPDLSYYRLKQVDFDGSFNYSQVVLVQMVKQEYTISVFPNPVSGTQLNLSGKKLDGKEILVTLNNNMGETVYSKVILLGQQNSFTTTINLENKLMPGMYLMIGIGKNEIFREKLIFIE